MSFRAVRGRPCGVPATPLGEPVAAAFRVSWSGGSRPTDSAGGAGSTVIVLVVRRRLSFFWSMSNSMDGPNETSRSQGTDTGGGPADPGRLRRFASRVTRWRACRTGTPIALAAMLSAGLPGVAPGQAVATDTRSGDLAPGRALVHQQWGIEDGLPLSHANEVLAASSGYLWLATYDGLVRFDGARFVIFGASNEAALPTSRFVTLREDGRGALWATAEFDHVVRYEDGRFDVFSLPDAYRGGAIRGLHFDSAGVVWVSTNRGLFSIRDGTLVPTEGTEQIPVIGLPYADADGAVWIATDGRGGLRWRNGRLDQFMDEDTALGSVGRGFAAAPGGGTYVATGSGILEVRGSSAQRLRLPVESPQIVRIIGIPGDTVLVPTDRGLLSLAGGELSVRDAGVTSVPAPTYAVRDHDGSIWFSNDRRLYRDGHLVFEANRVISGLTVDHEGSVWMTADGLHRFKPSLFDVMGAERGALANVYPIFEDSRSRVWIGALGGGIGRFEDGSFLPSVLEPSQLTQSIAEDADGRIWVGLINYGGYILGDSPERLEERFLPRHTIKAIYRDRSGQMWVGTDRGVYRDSVGDWLHLSTSEGLHHDFVRVILQSSDGAMWFGTNGGGIARYRDGTLEALSSRTGFPSDLVRAIYELAPGVLLVGTEDRGLIGVTLPEPSATLSAASVRTLDRRAGLYDDGVHSIVADGLGRLWMNTNRGIFWVPEAQLKEFLAGTRDRVRSIAYGESDGLSNPEGNGGVQSAAIRASDGRLWFAMQAGAAIVDPREIDVSNYPLPVFVEEVRSQDGRSVRGFSTQREPIELAPDERDFQVDYTALALLAPQNLRFQYRLSDFQSDWVDAVERRTAFFTNVPPGEYHFHLRVAREDGEWRELESPVAVTVQPFFHETAWFRSSVAASLLLVGVGGLRARERRRVTRERKLENLISERTATIEAQAAKLEEVDRAKSRFFANISHEFRTPLTLTIGPLEDLVSGQHGDLDPERLAPLQLSLRNSRRLLKLVNQLLEVAKLEARAVEVRASEADLVPFLRDIMQSFAPLAEREGIEARLLVPERPVLIFFDPDLLERVLLNLLSNAFKFTPEGGIVEIELTHPAPDGVTITVRDSGPGISEEQLPHLFDRFYQGEQSDGAFQPGTGIGLSLAKELVLLHGGRLDVESATGFGSTFSVHLRTGRDHFSPDQLRESPARRRGPGRLIDEELTAIETSRWHEGTTHGAAGGRSDSDDEMREDTPTILIVEDNVEVAAFVRSHLEGRFRCLEARDGEAALALTRQALPDVVVSDVMMPRMDGIALLKALRADADLAYVPVLLLTAKAGQEHKLEAFEAGATAFLTKPFDSAELESRIEGLIEQQGALRERVRRESILHPGVPDLATPADRFLWKLRETIEEHLSDEDFDVRSLARAMSESRSSLYRHIHDLVGETPSDLLKRMRLERAEAMLAACAGSVQHVAYAVGFRSVSHFSRCFREQYGVPPSRYVRTD